MNLELNHIGIKCSDIQASLTFYTEVMGLEKIYEVEVLGKPCIFVGNGTVQIELEASVVSIASPTEPPACGLTHFAFHVTGIEAVADELKSRGAPFLFPPFAIRPTRKTAMIKAPDGVLIQLIEDLPE
jgi:catechol 2,3-dioxygenase-like lactoylglutathione lyase family enzyme